MNKLGGSITEAVVSAIALDQGPSQVIWVQISMLAPQCFSLLLAGALYDMAPRLMLIAPNVLLGMLALQMAFGDDFQLAWVLYGAVLPFSAIPISALFTTFVRESGGTIPLAQRKGWQLRAAALRSVMDYGAQIIGPALVGLSISAVGRSLIVIDAVTFFVLAGCVLLLLSYREDHPRPSLLVALRGIGHAARSILGTPGISVFVALAAMFGILDAAKFWWFHEQFESVGTAVAMVYASSTIGKIIGSVAVRIAANHRQSSRLGELGLVVVATATLIPGLADLSLWTLFGSLVLFYIGGDLAWTAMENRLVHASGDGRPGREQAVFKSISAFASTSAKLALVGVGTRSNAVIVVAAVLAVVVAVIAGITTEPAD